jgi:hypothetical protein
MTNRASAVGCATSMMWLNATPCQVVSSFDQRVTQWMSSVAVATGSRRISPQLRVNGVSTAPKDAEVSTRQVRVGRGPPKMEHRELVGQHLAGRNPDGDLR